MSLILYNYVWLYLFIIRLYHLFYPPVLINIYSAEYIAYTYILFTDRKFKIIDIKSNVGTVQIVCLGRWIKGVYTAVAFILCMHILYKAFLLIYMRPGMYWTDIFSLGHELFVAGIYQQRVLLYACMIQAIYMYMHATWLWCNQSCQPVITHLTRGVSGIEHCYRTKNWTFL